VRSDLVARPRLYARLDAGLEGVLTLVAAPAGSGKTTILADWLHAQEQAEQPSGVAWLSLDSGDNDPVRFLGYLTAAIQHVVPELEHASLPISKAAQSASVEPVLSDLNTRIVARHHRAAIVYRLSQLRYDLAKLRAEGLVERLGTSRRYRLTQLGLKLGVLLVKLRRRLLGPLMTLTSTTPRPAASPLHPGGRAFAEVETALDHLSVALGLQPAA
jgi:hypothetical protein